MYVFFQKPLDNPGGSDDEEVKPLSLQELQATRTGQIATSLGGETVFSLNRKQAKKEEKRLQASRKENLSRHLTKAVKAAKDLLGYQEPDFRNQPVFWGRFVKHGYVIDKYFVKGAGGYPIPYLLFVPDKPNAKAVIYLDPAGTTANLHQEEWWARRG
jgi:hypothetical protein